MGLWEEVQVEVQSRLRLVADPPRVPAEDESRCTVPHTPLSFCNCRCLTMK